MPPSFPLRVFARPAPLVAARHPARRLHTTPLLSAYKDTQGREQLKPDATEGTKSGRDSDVSSESNKDAAFSPDKTRPETEKAAGGEALDVSGANQEVSKPQGDEKTSGKKGAGSEVRKGGASRGGGVPKGKKV